VANLYIGTDNSTWVYNGTNYSTKVVPASSNFYINGTNTDAGNNKTSAISRTGSIIVEAGGGIAIYGKGSLTGVYGFCDTSGDAGVIGEGVDTSGVWGYSDTNIGVLGTSYSGIGVQGFSDLSVAGDFGIGAINTGKIATFKKGGTEVASIDGLGNFVSPTIDYLKERSDIVDNITDTGAEYTLGVTPKVGSTAVSGYTLFHALEANPAGTVTKLEVQCGIAGNVVLKVFTKNLDNTFNVVSSQNQVLVLGYNSIILNIPIPLNGYFGFYGNAGRIAYSTANTNTQPYYFFNGEMLGNNIAVGLTSTQEGLLYKTTIQTGFLSYVRKDKLEASFLDEFSEIQDDNSNYIKKDNAILEMEKSLGSLPTNWINSGWNFASGKASNGTTGITQQLRTNKLYGADRRTIKWEFEITNANTVIQFLTNPIEGGVNAGSSLKLNSTTNELVITNSYTGANDPTSLVTFPLGFTMTTGVRYVLEWTKNARTFSVKIWNSSNNNVFTTSRTANTWGYTTYPAFGYDQGTMQGSPSIAVIAGSADFYSFEHSSDVSARPYIYMLGDSITEHFGVDDQFTLTKLMRDKFGDKKIMSSGVGGAVPTGAYIRIQNELINIRPKYVLIFLGSNSEANFENNLNLIINYAKSIGSKVLVATIPTNASYTATINALPSDIIKIDWATELTVSGAGSSRIVAYYVNTDGTGNQYNDNLHPNKLGELKRFRRLLADSNIL
jgi:hypothetical protein